MIVRFTARIIDITAGCEGMLERGNQFFRNVVSFVNSTIKIASKDLIIIGTSAYQPLQIPG